MRTLIVSIILLTFIGCADKNCDDQMAETRTNHGTAEEVNSYNSGDYHNVDWWYWSKGFQKSFTWGENIKGCEVSTYTFDPIDQSSLTDDTKEAARVSKVLTNRFFCPRTSMPTQ